MNLLDLLIEEYLNSHDSFPAYFDVITREIVWDADQEVTDEPGIDWDDEENEERYIEIPKLDSNEAYELMERFADVQTGSNQDALFKALNRPKPFRNFKDALYETDLWDQWNKFQNDFAKQVLEPWLQDILIEEGKPSDD